MTTREKEEIKEANLNKPGDHFIYDNIDIKWGVPENYEIISKLGRGRYSEVFEAIYKQVDTYCLKILKPIQTKKIKREIKILQLLSNHPNIVKLKDILRDSSTKTISLVFDYVNNAYYKTLYPQLTEQDIKLYMQQILKALDHAHSNGIMHRDIKPHNILIDPQSKTAVLIDWGLADFYFPDCEYTPKVASRFYKAPELLVGFKKYNYSIDIWGLGAVFAEMIFLLNPLFPGTDQKDQLEKITRLLGTNELFQYLDKYHIELDKSFETVLSKHKKSQFSFLVNKENQHLCGNDALDLLSKMLVYDHEQRITAKEALQHPFFSDIVVPEQDAPTKEVKTEGKQKKNKKKDK